jgi:D-serine deaminase-like pyridoxal phosphate-dependent protein
MIEESAERVRAEYGCDIGKPVDDVATPALILDLATVRRNIAHMASELRKLPAGIRPHIKVHKSPAIAQIQADHGVIGFSVATVWEAVTLAAAGFDDILVVNTIAGRPQIDSLITLAEQNHVIVAVDNPSNVAVLSETARAAGVSLGVLVEVDTGMDRAGVDSAEEALDLARVVLSSPGLDLEGVTGYEGHCSGVVDSERRAMLHRRAMDFLVDVVDRLADDGIQTPVRSAGGTTTWRWTASLPEVTEIQAGSYVLMDNFHGRMVTDFEHAVTVAATVVSRPPDRVIVDAGNKTVGVWTLASIKDSDLPVIRFDEEHGVLGLASPTPSVGDRVRIIPGYAPTTVNVFDAYHVAEEDVVVDIWPVIPRGPGHHGLACGDG